MSDADNIPAELLVGGVYYGGWTDISVTRSIEQVAGTFTLEVTERWPGSITRRPIRDGDACQVLLADQAVITGYVDDVEPLFDASSHTLRIQGRDKTGDLVDCSAIHKSGQWHNVKLDVIARDLLKPFGIGLKVDVDVGSAFPSWNIEEGESVFENLSRAARLRGVLLISDTEGNLVVTRASTNRIEDAALIEGENIEAGEGRFSWRDRFSQYIIKGQAKATDDFFGEAASQVLATAKDDVVDRYRPLVILPEDHGSGGTMRDRAEWERNVRRGRSNRATVTVPGWARPNGLLWTPNTLVPVKSESLAVDADMLIAGCTWKRGGERGTVTQLAIASPSAFALLSGVTAGGRLGKKMFEKEEKRRKQQGADWSIL
ncbi:contractile injection system protein, VgrG/Pvc8 family [Denitratisoma sp. agr-D3]